MRTWATRAVLALSVISMAIAVAPVADAANGNKVVVCHATSSSTNPYVTIVVDKNSTEYEGHLGHVTGGPSGSDIIGPDGGVCPGPDGNGGSPPDGKITICHATSSATNPYVTITVSVNSTAYQGHLGHVTGGPSGSDIIPAPPEGCPGPGYNPDDVELRAEFVGGDQVRFLFRGCPKHQVITVEIGDVPVVGGTFTVPNNDTVIATVAIPDGATNDVIQVTCDRPLIVWEAVIGETPPVDGAAASAKGPQAITFENPAAVTAGGVTGKGTSSPLPGRQLGFGLGSIAGLVAFGGLRRSGRKPQPFGT
jgi:hypothetical protein